ANDAIAMLRHRARDDRLPLATRNIPVPKRRQPAGSPSPGSRPKGRRGPHGPRGPPGPDPPGPPGPPGPGAPAPVSPTRPRPRAAAPGDTPAAPGDVGRTEARPTVARPTPDGLVGRPAGAPG